MMMGCTPALNWTLIGAVVFALSMFGLAYNALVSKLGEHKDGFTSLLVVAGVIVTLIGLALVWWQAALAAGLAFIPSGIPMILGDIARYVLARRQALEAMRQAGRSE